MFMCTLLVWLTFVDVRHVVHTLSAVLYRFQGYLVHPNYTASCMYTTYCLLSCLPLLALKRSGLKVLFDLLSKELP